jgi:hypothetical protein
MGFVYGCRSMLHMCWYGYNTQRRILAKFLIQFILDSQLVNSESRGALSVQLEIMVVLASCMVTNCNLPIPPVPRGLPIAGRKVSCMHAGGSMHATLRSRQRFS